MEADLSRYYKDGETTGAEEVPVDIPRGVTGCAEPIPFIPPWVDTVARKDTTRPIYIVESPQKAVALWQLGLYAIALAGVSAGAHDGQAWQSERLLRPSKELARIDWAGRRAFILFDAGIQTNPQVALGAAKLAFLLRSLKAHPQYVLLPMVRAIDLSIDEAAGFEESDQGPDDFLARKARETNVEGAREALGVLVTSAVETEPSRRLRQALDQLEGKSNNQAREDAAREVLSHLPTVAALFIGGGASLDPFAAEAKKAGITRKTIIEAVGTFAKRLSMRKENPEWEAKLQLLANGSPRPNEYNIGTILRSDSKLAGKLYFDLLNQCVAWRQAPPWEDQTPPSDKVLMNRTFTDDDSTRLIVFLSENYRLDAVRQMLDPVVDVIANERKIDPWRSYMESLTWDGLPRLDGMLSRYFGQRDDRYSKLISSLWMLQIAARTYRPGCKADGVLVLKGEQGMAKSKALKALIGETYFSDCDLDLESKEVASNLAGKIVYEFGEGVVLSKKDAAVIKAFVSRTVERYTPKFKSRTIEVPRRTVFALTTNEDAFLTDSTGNRRYWVIEVGRIIDEEGLFNDREQLLAEAVFKVQGRREVVASDGGRRKAPA